jgi:hypothetical protein
MQDGEPNMAKIQLITYNILELGTVSVSGSPDSGYPEERLWDRSQRFYWKVTDIGTFTVEVDQGSSILGIDTIVIEGHNFDGLVLNLQRSNNGSSWTTVTSWTQSGNGQIVKNLDSVMSYRYWKLNIISVTNPQCTEIFIGKGYPFQVRFDQPPGGMDLPNVNWVLTYGGFERSEKRSEDRKKRAYSVFHDQDMSEGSLADYREAVGYLDSYSKPFYIKDHEGDYWLCKLEAFDETYITEGSTERMIEVVEQL